MKISLPPYAKNIRILRLQKDLTQGEIAQCIGIKERRYINYENGTTEPNIDTIQRLARFYNVSSDIIIGSLELKEPETKPEKRKYNIRIMTENGTIIVPRNTIKNNAVNLGNNCGNINQS